MEGESYYLSRCNHRRFTAFLPNDRTIEPRAHANPPRVTTTKKTPGGDTRLNRQLAVLYCQRLLWLSTRVIEKIVGLFALSADWTGFIRLSRTDSLYLNRAPDKIALSAPDRAMWNVDSTTSRKESFRVASWNYASINPTFPWF